MFNLRLTTIIILLFIFSIPLFTYSQKDDIIPILTGEKDTIIRIYKLPSVNIKTMDGKTINTSDINNNGKPIILSFWATWCKACLKEYAAISEVYPEWQKETGVKLIAISIDDSRTKANVLPLINGKEWDYEFYFDENSDLKRALNVNYIPHLFVLNGKKDIIWQHTSYSEGDENEILKYLKSSGN
jgi:cytochrome c biogenesis protein CcmG, thiol:disulfide interchange protein DsbE